MDKPKTIEAMIVHVNELLSQHGGSASIVDLDSKTGRLFLRFSGNCAKCPGRILGTKKLIENMLTMNGFPYKIRVVD